MSQTSVINRSSACFFYTHQTSGACAGICASDRMHQTDDSMSNRILLN